MNKVWVGKLSSPFGLKGEIKVVSNINHQDKIFIKNQTIIVDDQEYKLESARFHKNNYLILISGFNDINLLDNILGKDIFVNRENIKLQDNEFLLSDLECCQVYDEKLIGKVEDIYENKLGVIIRVNGILIPLNEKYFEKLDTESKIIYVKNSGELDI